jgi:5-methylcytosine-specific restriction endonuclease McrA
MPLSKRQRRKIYKACDGVCFFCGIQFLPHVDALHPRKFTVDHLIPRKLGGTNDMRNLVAACRLCNQLKKDILFRSHRDMLEIYVQRMDEAADALQIEIDAVERIRKKHNL